MALPAIPDELLVEILLRLPTPEDLIRASAACVSIRRLVANRAFLRRFRKLHPAPLLGFVDYKGFHPALPPHPSAPAASAVASAADFDFTFLPAPYLDWTVREVRDGRVLLDRPGRHAGEGLGSVFKEIVVCDPLHRQHLRLPPLPDDLAASVVAALLTERPCFGEPFLVPSADDEEAGATEETSFRVIWMMLLQTKPVVFVFSSGTGQWQAISSLTQSDSLPGFALSTWMFWFVSRHYAHGCFYWVSGTSEKLLVLDIQTMEFSMVDHPPCARFPGDDVAIVEAGQGMTVMFVPKPDTAPRIYTVWRNNGGSSTQWQMENEPFSLDSGSLLQGAVGRHLLLYYVGSSSLERGCYTQDVDTFQLERVCGSCPQPSEAYCNFPPSFLSSPTVSSGSRSSAATLPGCRRLVVSLRSRNHRGFRLPRPRPLLQRLLRRRPVRHQAARTLATSAIPQGTCHADVQGAGDDVLVPEPREAYPGGVQGPVVAAAAHALNPLFVVEGTCHAEVQGAGEPEVREADPGSLQGPVVVAAARALNPLFVIDGARRGDIQGAGDDVMVPEVQEADPQGVQGPVVAAAARVLNPLLVVEGSRHADVLGTGDAVLVPEPREAGPGAGGMTLCNAGAPHADVVQGAGRGLAVPGVGEADPGGVQGAVVAAVAQAPNPLLVVDNNDDAEAGRGGARGRRRWGWGWTCGRCRGGGDEGAE